MMDVWQISWELIKLAVLPLCLYYFQRMQNRRDAEAKARDAKREKEFAERKRELEEQQKKNTEIQFLMMERMDSVCDMTQMMAKKLHDAGIINGDLEEMNQKYAGLNSQYESSIKSLALKVLNKSQD